MGAWGEGMQANDTALDYIDGLEKYKSRKDKQQAFIDSPLWGASNDEHDNKAQGILGMADCMLDEGIEVPKEFVPNIERLARGQLRRQKLDCWNDPDKREAALTRFLDRLHGREVDETALEADNEGLISKMSR